MFAAVVIGALRVKPFTSEFLKWTLPPLYLVMSIIVNRVFFLLRIINRLENSVDPDEMAHYEPSHLDLYCLCRCLYWSTGLKGLNERIETLEMIN